MNILGIGPFELLIIFLVAFLFLGPEKLSKFSKDFANYVRGFNKQKQELNDLINYSKRFNITLLSISSNKKGILFGTFATGASLGMATGSFLGGAIHDLTGTYHAAFMFSFFFGACSLFLVWLYPEKNNLKPAEKEKTDFALNP